MSKMSELVLEMQELIMDNIGAPNGKSFEEIAKVLNVPVEWVVDEYEAMVSDGYA